ncbi:MAG: sporulation integral membrane protein YtvI [Oscillospiraceae bacterium]|nr:sporulation integral membrane protein YtvI [Oscillospiraceae bacterium]
MPNSFLRRILTVLLWSSGTYLFFRYFLTPMLPFLLALGLSALLEPLVQYLHRSMGVTRAFAATVITTGVLLSVGSIIFFLFFRLGTEFAEWSSRLPETVASFPTLWNNALTRIESWYISCPPFLRYILDHLADTLGENASTLAAAAGGWLMEKISSLAAILPNLGLFCTTTILALYFTSISYNSILSFLKRQLPRSWQMRCRTAAQCCRSTMLKWLFSEILLICVTFFILLMGFWWIRLPYTLLAAFSIALVDALPVLGTGMVLIPWAALSLLLGNTQRGLSLLILYAVVLLVHSLLEPRLLAGQGNLPPITVLFAIYFGVYFMGIGGMILFPILLLLLKQLQDAGVVKLWQ